MKASAFTQRFAVMGFALVMACALACALAGTASAVELGAKFTKDGNTYKVTEAYENAHDWGEVTLVKYGSSNTKPTVNTVKYKGETFEVEVIAKNAFNNTKGHKITSIKLGDHVDKIGAKAFYGCSKLKSIDMRTCEAIDIDKEHGKYVIDDLDIGSKAFAKAGVSSVKVKCGSSNASYQKLFKKALVSKGLRSNAKIVK
ncbi:MAG: leucine-rich repeat protein [Coriobacteriia bacterium]|nr:leucine-rich repeat protein [Coriobacteriia bacterium]